MPSEFEGQREQALTTYIVALVFKFSTKKKAAKPLANNLVPEKAILEAYRRPLPTDPGWRLLLTYTLEKLLY